MLWRPGLRPGPRWGACSAPQTPRGILGRKDRKRKGGEEMSERKEMGGGTKRRGRGIERKEDGTLLISFAPSPTSEPWRRHCKYIHNKNGRLDGPVDGNVLVRIRGRAKMLCLCCLTVDGSSESVACC